MSFSEKIVTGAALFISCLALFVSIMQTKIMQDQKSASVWPYVQIGTSFSNKKFSFDVDNEGIGPAKIIDMEYAIGDKKFDFIHNMTDYIEKKEGVKMNYAYSNLGGGNQVLIPGESRQVLNLKIDSDTIQNIIEKYLYNVAIRIEYCSIYNECWVNKNGLIKEK